MKSTRVRAIVLLFATACFSQDKAPTQPREKAIEWVNISVPKFPQLARQARILGTVVIEVRFKGCELDPESPRLVSGHPVLAGAALEAVKHSTIRCGDFTDSKTTVYYEFGHYDTPGCDSGYQRTEITGSHVRILAKMACVETNSSAR